MTKMATPNKKKNKKIDLLQVNATERIQLIKKARETFQMKLAEEKLWQSLLNVDNLTINGNTVYSENEQLKGLSF